jgi:hypothetical protein
MSPCQRAVLIRTLRTERCALTTVHFVPAHLGPGRYRERETKFAGVGSQSTVCRDPEATICLGGVPHFPEPHGHGSTDTATRHPGG